MTEHSDGPDLKRREFFGKTLAAAAVTVAPGVFLHTMADARQPSEPVTDKVRWGMLIDTGKCAEGCNACVTACDEENGLTLLKKPEGLSDAMWEEQRPQWIRKVTLRDKQTDVITRLVMLCQHCEFPPCVDVCPTNASFKRADGIVMVDRHTCIGCRYCMMACPYKARSFLHQDVASQRVEAPRGKGCVESCTFCVHLLDAGEKTTACTEACRDKGHNAITFGDLKDPDSDISKALKTYTSRQVRADLELNTGVRYTNI